jgi:hypothetical protein
MARRRHRAGKGRIVVDNARRFGIVPPEQPVRRARGAAGGRR